MMLKQAAAVVWSLSVSSYYLSLQVVSVPEGRCFQTVCPPVPPAAPLPSPPALLQPWDSAGRSVWGAVSVHQVSIFTKDAV